MSAKNTSFLDSGVDLHLKISNYEETVRHLDIYYGIGQTLSCFCLRNAIVRNSSSSSNSSSSVVSCCDLSGWTGPGQMIQTAETVRAVPDRGIGSVRGGFRRTTTLNSGCERLHWLVLSRFLLLINYCLNITEPINVVCARVCVCVETRLTTHRPSRPRDGSHVMFSWH